MTKTTTTEDADFGLLYTYALVTAELAKEIRIVAKEVQDLFGSTSLDAGASKLK